MNHKQGWASGAMRRNAFAFLTRQERRKYEIARELGLLDRVKAVGWAGLSAKETGRIGGLMGRENRRSAAGSAGLTGDKRRRMNACTPHLHPYTTG